MKRSLVTPSLYQRFLLSRFHPTKELVLTTSGDGEHAYLLFQRLLCQIPELPVSLLSY
jgi:hypothetical protein